MFTGIIEQLGTVRSNTRIAAGRRLGVDLGPVAVGTRLGDSIAVNGACLTITTLAGSLATFDLSPETCSRTTLGRLTRGAVVNLERALALGDRLGGHLVSGHVDGIGRLAQRHAEGSGARLVISLPADGSVRVVEKGSLSVEGISLTTYACSPDSCTIAVVPHTLAHTTLGTLRVGAVLNLEQDLIGRWVQSLVAPHLRG